MNLVMHRCLHRRRVAPGLHHERKSSEVRIASDILRKCAVQDGPRILAKGSGSTVLHHANDLVSFARARDAPPDRISAPKNCLTSVSFTMATFGGVGALAGKVSPIQPVNAHRLKIAGGDHVKIHDFVRHCGLVRDMEAVPPSIHRERHGIDASNRNDTGKSAHAAAQFFQKLRRAYRRVAVQLWIDIHHQKVTRLKPDVNA